MNEKEIADLFWDTAPVLELRLDDPPASTLFDDHALIPHDGTCSGVTCPVSGVQGRGNQAVILDGTDDAIAVSDTETLGLSESSFTVSAWVNLDTVDNEPVVGTVGANPAELILLGVDSTLPYILIDGTSFWGSTPVSAGQWAHLVWRNQFDASTGESQLAMFLDGTMVFSTTANVQLEGNLPLYIGRYNGLHLDGQIDHVQIFRQALTDAEIDEVALDMPLINLQFNEADGATTFFNAAGTPNATCSGGDCPIANIKGQMYGAVYFDGQDDQVMVPHSADFQTDSYSVGFWVRPQRKPTKQTMLHTDPAFGLQFYLELPPDSLQVYAQTRAVGCVYDPAREMTSAASLLENSWNHIMLTYGDDEQKLYINGVLSAEKTVAGGICHSTDDIIIGRRSTDAVAGSMDEFVYYGSVLTPAEIADLVAYQSNWFDTAYQHPIVIDTDLPTVAISATAPFLPDDDVILAINAQDPTSGIALVEYNINGGGWFSATQDGEAWLFTFTPNGNGAYTVQTRATDGAGQIAVNSQVLNVDGTPPIIVPISSNVVRGVERNETTNSWDLELIGTVLPSDGPLTPTSPISVVVVSLVDEVGLPVSGHHTATLTAAGFPFLWNVDYPFERRPNGTYTVTIEAADGVGNRSQLDVPILVDGTPPVADIRYTGSITATLNSGIVITGWVEDEGISSIIDLVEIGFHPTGYNDLSSVRVFSDSNVLHLPLDDNPAPPTSTFTAGSMTFVDLSNFVNHAVCSNDACPVAAERGWLGNAAHFDGVDDYLTVISATDNLTGTAYSFGSWVNPGSGSGDEAMIAFKEADAIPTSLLFYRHTTNQFIYWDAVAGEQASSAFATDSWHHVWVTVGSDDSAVLYVNGEVEATFSTTVRPAISDDIKLGRAWDGGDYRYFTGLLDDVAVYSVGLDAAQIKRHYRGFGPVLRLALDEEVLAHGERLQDTTRYENTAVFTQLLDPGKIQYPLPGAVGAGAYDFNTAYISMTAQTHFDLTDAEFTQMAWVYPQTNPPDQVSPIFGGTVDQITGFAETYPSLFITDTTKLMASMGDGATGYVHVTGDILTANQWNFVATTYDGTDYHFYVNGVLQETTGAFAGISLHQTTEFDVGHFDINGLPFNTSHIFGYLDEVSMYRQTFTPKQIMALYHQGWQPTTLIPVGVNTAEWQYTVPEGLQGSYQIQLRTSDTLNDSYGSQSNIGWEGYINPPDFSDLFPDMQLTKDDSGLTVEPGDTVTYTLTYTNIGGSTNGVVLTDTVPLHTTFNPTASTPGWACLPDNNAGSVCTLAVGSLAKDATNSVNFVVMVDNPIPLGVNQIDNSAAIGDDGNNGPDQNTADNTASVSTTLSSFYGVALSGDASLSGLPGVTVTYTVSISNSGNNNDTFDLSLSGNSWPVTLSQPTITLAVGTVSSFEVMVEIPGGGIRQ